MLKLSHRDDDVRGEATALRTWAGRGAVRLLDYDVEGDVLLLERLDASRSLVDCPPEEVSRAVGRLLRELAVPAPTGRRPRRRRPSRSPARSGTGNDG